MAIITQIEGGMTRIDFEISNGRLSYKDAITVPTEEFNNMTAKQLLDEQQARFDAWVYTIENPIPVVIEEPPIVEEPILV